MSVLPLNMIKGTRSVRYERLENTEDMEEVEQQIEKLKVKVCGKHIAEVVVVVVVVLVYKIANTSITKKVRYPKGVVEMKLSYI